MQISIEDSSNRKLDAHTTVESLGSAISRLESAAQGNYDIIPDVGDMIDKLQELDLLSNSAKMGGGVTVAKLYVKSSRKGNRKIITISTSFGWINLIWEVMMMIEKMTKMVKKVLRMLLIGSSRFADV